MEQLLLLSGAEASALVKKIKDEIITAHGHIAQAGRWLIELRDREGWRSLGYDTWSQCAAEEFRSTHGARSHIFRLIQHAEVIENLGPENPESDVSGSKSGGQVPRVGLEPTPIRQTQHLAKVPAEQQKKTYQRAVELGNGKATETTVKKAVEEVLKTAKPAKEIHRDRTGYAIPDEILYVWNRKSEIKNLLAEISKARSAVREAMDCKDPLFWPSNVSGAFVNLSAAYNTIDLSTPYAVCPTCQGLARDTCTLCKGRGFISKFLFDTVVPEELIAIRAKSCVL